MWGFTSLKFLQLEEIERYLEGVRGKGSVIPWWTCMWNNHPLCPVLLSAPQSLSPWELLFLLPTGVAILELPPAFTSYCS